MMISTTAFNKIIINNYVRVFSKVYPKITFSSLLVSFMPFSNEIKFKTNFTNCIQ